MHIGLFLMAVSSTGLLLNLSVGLILGLALICHLISCTTYLQWVVLHRLKSVALRWVLPVQQALLGNSLCCHRPYCYYKMLVGLAALIVSAILIALIVPLAWMLKAPMYVKP